MIKRYDIAADTPYAVIHEYNVEGGSYVKYEDHTAEVSRLNENISALTASSHAGLGISEKYYVSGCIADEEGEITICEDSEAKFWTLYSRNSEGLSEGIIDCVFREDAEAAMAVYVERDRLNEQVRALAAENAEQSRYINEAKKCMAFYVPDSDKPSNLQSPATDAILNEVRALAVEGYAKDLRSNAGQCASNEQYTYAERLHTEADRAERYAARIRAGEVQP